MLVYATPRSRWLTNMHNRYGSKGIDGIHSATRVKQVSAPKRMHPVIQELKLTSFQPCKNRHPHPKRELGCSNDSKRNHYGGVPSRHRIYPVTT